jgi:D-3-phosphoglycerate dehydrogenase / 2-oxoglutarate reductase
LEHRVLVCDTMDVAILGLSGAFEVDYEPKITHDELMARVEDYDALVVRSRTKVDAGVIARATRLKLIVRPGSGVDNIDVAAAAARGIEVVSSPESLVESVAEHVIGLMLALARSTPSVDASMKGGPVGQGALRRDRTARKDPGHRGGGKDRPEGRRDSAGARNDAALGL